MSRNGSGTYSVPNTFSPGQTISSADHNENFDDLGDEITNSVAADGQTTMTGPLKASSGTAAAPALTFAADPDTGFYRSAGNEIGIAAGGVAVGLISTASAHFYGALIVSGTATFGAIGTANFVASAAFTHGSFSGRLAVSATATFTSGFIASATCTFAGAINASATATFTTGVSAATVSGGIVATQAQMETGTATNVVVTPGRQHFHPGHPKAWLYVTYSGGTPTLAASYNVSGITDLGAGSLSWTYSTALSAVGAFATDALDASVTVTRLTSHTTTGGTVDITNSAGANKDPAAVSIVIYGDI
jgi:hypothetical protein